MSTALLAAILAAASPSFAVGPAEGDLMRLTAPRAGAVLVAGSEAELAWEAGDGLAAFVDAREWEAFLSVDGGRSYPYRLTPHLDLHRRRVRFRVPEVASDDVRLMLRVGDERDERVGSTAGRWRIVPGTLPPPPAATAATIAIRGEAARPGDRGVVSWFEETPGGGWVEVRTAGPEAVVRLSSDRPHPVGGLAESAARGPAPLAAAAAAVPLLPPVAAHRPSRLRLLSRPILLLVRRLNE